MTSLERARLDLMRAVEQVDGNARRYAELQREHSGEVRRLEDMEDAYCGAPEAGLRGRIVGQYRSVAGLVDQLRDLSSDITFALGELANRARAYAQKLEQD